MIYDPHQKLYLGSFFRSCGRSHREPNPEDVSGGFFVHWCQEMIDGLDLYHVVQKSIWMGYGMVLILYNGWLMVWNPFFGHRWINESSQLKNWYFFRGLRYTTKPKVTSADCWCHICVLNLQQMIIPITKSPAFPAEIPNYRLHQVSTGFDNQVLLLMSFVWTK